MKMNQFVKNIIAVILLIICVVLLIVSINKNNISKIDDKEPNDKELSLTYKNDSIKHDTVYVMNSDIKRYSDSIVDSIVILNKKLINTELNLKNIIKHQDQIINNLKNKKKSN